MNVVVVKGRLARPAEERVLPSGDRLVAFEVTVAAEEGASGGGGKAETVPVVWLDAPGRAAELDVDEVVVAVGRVRRRFFRAGGSLQSRTEVVAEAVIPARHAKKVSALV